MEIRSQLARGARLGALFVLGAVLSAWGAATDIADVPMAVKNNVPPNFMFMIDNSGSMTTMVPDAPYNPATTYISCPSNRKVSTNSSVSLFIKNGVPYIGIGNNASDFSSLGTGKNQFCFDSTATYSAALWANTSLGGGWFGPDTGFAASAVSGNYLNWYFSANDGPVTGWVDRKLLTDTTKKVRPRIEVAQTAAVSALNAMPLPPTAASTAKVRVGLSTYNADPNASYGDGGKLLEGMGDLTATKLSSITSAINQLACEGNTPLSETAADIGWYFTSGYTGNLTLHPTAATPTTASVANTFKQNSSSPHKLLNAPASCSGTSCPVQYWCQRSYSILLTDGLPTADTGLSTNSYLKNYYGSDYLVNVASALYEVDLRPDLAAPAGRTKKNNVRTYTVGFADPSLASDPLLANTAAQGGGLFLTANNLSTLTTAFSSAINDALAKDAASAAVTVVNTQISVDNTAYASTYSSGTWTGDLLAYGLNTSTGIPIQPAVWSAQAKLDTLAAANRNIVTYDGSSGAIFSATSSGLAANLVSYLRGDRSLEGTTYRRRSHLLGDIINSEPVVVKYSDKPIVFQGANDGMLHVFNGSISATDIQAGQELWAYVPRIAYGSLTNLASTGYTHNYFVDATPAVADITVSGTTSKILVGGLGKGGRGYYALNISSYAAAAESGYASKVLWEALGTDSRMGYSYGKPVIVNTPNDGWVVLVASGYNNGSDTGGDGHGRVFALNPLTGAVLHVIDTGVGDAATPAGLAHLSKLSNALPTDTIKFVYGGDLLGNVWRFDLTNWNATRIAVVKDGSGATQPISSAPAVGTASGAAGYFVYVGTGLYLGDSDVPGNTPQNASATQVQSVYGIIDDTSTASPTLPDIRGGNGATCPNGGGTGSFVCQDPGSQQSNQYTNTNYGLSNTQTGWYFDLPIANARVVTHPLLTSGGALVLTVNVPTNVTCDPGGSSWFVNVAASNGGAIVQEVGGNKYWPSMSLLGYALASRPVIVESADGKRAVIRMSDQTFQAPQVREPPVPPASAAPTWRRIYWRELM